MNLFVQKRSNVNDLSRFANEVDKWHQDGRKSANGLRRDKDARILLPFIHFQLRAFLAAVSK